MLFRPQFSEKNGGGPSLFFKKDWEKIYYLLRIWLEDIRFTIILVYFWPFLANFWPVLTSFVNFCHYLWPALTSSTFVLVTASSCVRIRIIYFDAHTWLSSLELSYTLIDISIRKNGGGPSIELIRHLYRYLYICINIIHFVW